MSDLREQAMTRDCAHAPYSNFHVGVAVKTTEGRFSSAQHGKRHPLRVGVPEHRHWHMQMAPRRAPVRSVCAGSRRGRIDPLRWLSTAFVEFGALKRRSRAPTKRDEQVLPWVNCCPWPSTCRPKLE